jgi:amino acid transporter
MYFLYIFLFKSHFPISMGNHLSDHFDLLAFSIILLYTAALAFGVKESVKLTMVFTCVNLFVIGFTIVNGLFLVNTDNWKIEKQNVPADRGVGGFAPYGFAGIMKGAATCFYAFVGFDAICNASEEAKDPKRAIPIAVITALSVSFVAYAGVSSVVTMMVPYYRLNEESPLASAFIFHGWKTTATVITFGSMCGLATSLMGSIYPLPRIAYAMASDGLIFKVMAQVSGRFKTPMVSTVLVGLISAAVASIFNLDQLVDMMSIGTLMTYTLVAMCVLILRFEVNPEEKTDPKVDQSVSWRAIRARLMPRNRHAMKPDSLSFSIATILVLVYLVMCILVCFSVIFLGIESWFGMAATGSCVASMLILVFFLALLPVSTIQLSFRVSNRKVD